MKRYICSIPIFCLVFLLSNCTNKTESGLKPDIQLISPVWHKDITGKYPFSMTAVVRLSDSLQSALNLGPYDQVGAFVNGECRGTGVLVPSGSSYLYYLLIQGSASENSKVTFKYYNGLSHSLFSTAPLLAFSVDASFGSPDKPVILPLLPVK